VAFVVPSFDLVEVTLWVVVVLGKSRTIGLAVFAVAVAADDGDGSINAVL
jgi:hypothetical protein